METELVRLFRSSSSDISATWIVTSRTSVCIPSLRALFPSTLRIQYIHRSNSQRRSHHTHSISPPTIDIPRLTVERTHTTPDLKLKGRRPWWLNPQNPLTNQFRKFPVFCCLLCSVQIRSDFHSVCLPDNRVSSYPPPLSPSCSSASSRIFPV